MSSKETEIAVITGGSRGIGRSTVLHLAERGVTSIFTYNAHKEEAEAVVAEVKKTGAEAVALPLDTTDVNTFDAFVKTLRGTLATLGAEQFDYLVNNAGTGMHKEYEKVTEEEFDGQYKIHVKGPYFLTQRLLPLIKDGGRIVNIASGLTRFSMNGSGTYAIMKGAVEVFTRYLAKELGPRCITANTVAPGAIATDFNGGRTRDDKETNQMVASVTALGRAGKPEDIGPVIVSLLSEETHWINAQRIEVSGGMML